MLKLIASDIDGTLLQNGKRELSLQAVEQIKQLKEMGILFAAASGRQYAVLRNLFEPVKDDIAYICENGAMVVYKGKILHKDVFERALAEEMAHSILNREDMEIIVSGEKSYYIQPKNFRGTRRYFKNIHVQGKWTGRNAALLEKAFWRQSNSGDFRSCMAGYDADECG